MNVYKEIQRLINYGLGKGLIFKEDELYARNRLLEVLGLDEFEPAEVEAENLETSQPILDKLLDYACQKELLPENTTTYRDLLDTRLMDCLMPRPSEVIRNFNEDYKNSPQKATENYYRMAIASNYIRMDRINKNLSWKASTDYGELDITINLSKPEKDPKAIAAAKNMKAKGYPKCLLCKENEGYGGRINYPARQNHRIIPVELCGEEWFLQYSPYVYYNEHCIVFKSLHEPMKITEKTFKRLLEFTAKFPHYFIGSNADLPIVGGSILSHDHFQGGNYCFAMEKAEISRNVCIKGFEDVEAGIVKWPMSVIRIRSRERERLAELAVVILNLWREYDDESVGIISHSEGEPHNTITPISRYKNGKFELDLVLRNNRTSEEHPLGIFHPHSDVHNIKKENIGLIEVMGLAVLPARLVNELELLEQCLIGDKCIDDYRELDQHRKWFRQLKSKYAGMNVDYSEILRFEVGKVFERVLEDAGVFKRDDKGQKAFLRFIDVIRKV